MASLDLSAEGTEALLSFTKELALAAGKMIRSAFVAPRNADYELKSATDPVTETDRAVEAMLFDTIRGRYPDHELIGEESASGANWTEAPTWIIDPIDGTANFVHRIPLCAVSIGLTVGREYKIGVIYNPILDEMFEATHLTGSRLNGEGIGVSGVRRLQSACVATECGSDRAAGKVGWVLEQLEAVLRNQAQCVRMMGSCALNMAHVACGRVDLLYEVGPHPWDMAAGVLIVRQAGGVVCGGGLQGMDEPFELTGRSLLAFTPSLREELGQAFCCGERDGRDFGNYEALRKERLTGSCEDDVSGGPSNSDLQEEKRLLDVLSVAVENSGEGSEDLQKRWASYADKVRERLGSTPKD